MKILIVGTGAVGGYYGGALAKGGNDVFFIARGKRLAALRRKGLTINSFQGDFHLTAPAGASGAPFGLADLILLCVKSYDLVESFELCVSNVGSHTIIIPFGNGVESERLCANRFGAEKIMGGVSFIGATLDAAYVVHHTAHGRIAIGEMGGEMTDRAERMGALFERAGVRCKISDNIQRDLYAKMIWNVGFNALCAIHDRSANELAADPQLSLQVRDAMEEWIVVAQGMGVPLKESMAQKNIDATLEGGVIIPSMLQDWRNGKRLENDIFNAYVVRKGETLNIATPMNRSIAERVAAL